MNEMLLRNINQRCHEDDLLIHCGDLAQYGNDRKWRGVKTNPREFIVAMKPTFINIEGNHDRGNKVKSVCTSMRTTLGKKYVSVSLGHYPSNHPAARGTFRKGDVHLCGHVHGRWKYLVDFDNKVLNINVGVDENHRREVAIGSSVDDFVVDLGDVFLVVLHRVEEGQLVAVLERRELLDQRAEVVILGDDNE